MSQFNLKIIHSAPDTPSIGKCHYCLGLIDVNPPIGDGINQLNSAASGNELW